MKLIVFVCVSNTCRSPMAEHLMRLKLQQRGLQDKFSVVSRSLSTDYEPEGSPASSQGVQVMQETYGVDMTGHRSKLLDTNDIRAAYLIIPVKRDLGRFISSTFDDAAEKVKYLTSDVADPWHQPVSVFQSCAAQISTLLDTVLSDLEA